MAGVESELVAAPSKGYLVARSNESRTDCSIWIFCRRYDTGFDGFYQVYILRV